MSGKTDELVAAIDILWENFNYCKSHFPYMQDEKEGAKNVKTAPNYVTQGADISFEFPKGISAEAITMNNEVDKWINENFIVRLCDILESYRIISKKIKVNFILDGAEEMSITRRLRHALVYSSGIYNSEDKGHCLTMELMKDKLGISIEGLTEWDLSVDTVLTPLYEGCRKYVIGLEELPISERSAKKKHHANNLR
ncbi:hypothetical protein ACFL6K_05675 [Candidatus Latescibacterota bacterium]